MRDSGCCVRTHTGINHADGRLPRFTWSGDINHRSKTMDQNEDDKRLREIWGTSNSPGTVAPSNRVQRQLGDGYPQVKRSSEGKWPTMIVVYNNSGDWNWIDTFLLWPRQRLENTVSCSACSRTRRSK